MSMLYPTTKLKAITAAVLLASAPAYDSVRQQPVVGPSEHAHIEQRPIQLAVNTVKPVPANPPTPFSRSDVDNSPLTVLAAIPKGFESFHEPQLTAVDVYYGGRLITTTIAEYTPDNLRFLKPAQVSAAIAGLKNQDAVTEMLAAPLDNNADRICEEPRQPLCGNLSPDQVAVIFDANRFRATLFVNPDLLEAAALQDPRYLPPPDKDRVTVVQNLNALATGNNNGQDQYSLYGTTRAGYNGHYGFADWISTDRQSMSFDQLGYRHVLRDHEITAGLFEPSADALRSLRRDLILGAGIATSVNLRQDLASIVASPIELFLPIRGRVDIFRDGRLISSGFYEAGNQLVDSTRLPNGAYLIDIVITDDAGNSRTEQQLFVKSTLLPPPGEPQWFVEAGQVRLRSQSDVLPEDINANLLRSGYRWRQQDWLGFGAASAITDDEFLGEVSSNIYTDWSELGGELYGSNQGGWGWGLRGSARWNQTNFSVSSQRSFQDDNDFVVDAAYPLIPQNRWLYSAQASRPVLRNGLASISHTHSGSDPGDRSRKNTVSYTYNQFLGNGKAITYRSEVSDIDGDQRILLSIQLRATSRHWNNTAQLDWVDSDLNETEGAAAAVSTAWRDQDIFIDDVELGANARVDDDTRSLNLSGRHQSQYGSGRAEVSASKTDLLDTRQYLLGYDTSIVLDEKSRLSIGSPLPGESAVVLDLEGADGAVVDISTDGQRQFSARGGGRVPMTLQPYRQYEVSIRDRGTQLLKYDNDSVGTSLYVGDVDSLDFQASKINVLVSRLYNVEDVCSEVTGECYQIPMPMRSTAITGAEGILFTDSEGYFQGEVATSTSQLVAEIKGEACYVDLTGLEAANGVMRVARLYCSTAAQLEAEANKQQEDIESGSGETGKPDDVEDNSTNDGADG